MPDLSARVPGLGEDVGFPVEILGPESLEIGQRLNFAMGGQTAGDEVERPHCLLAGGGPGWGGGGGKRGGGRRGAGAVYPLEGFAGGGPPPDWEILGRGGGRALETPGPGDRARGGRRAARRDRVGLEPCRHRGRRSSEW